MKSHAYTHQDLVRLAQFTPDDLTKIRECRQKHTRLGFAYQLAFVRLHHRFPAQQPLEIDDEIVTYVSVQLDIPALLMPLIKNIAALLSIINKNCASIWTCVVSEKQSWITWRRISLMKSAVIFPGSTITISDHWPDTCRTVQPVA